MNRLYLLMLRGGEQPTAAPTLEPAASAQVTMVAETYRVTCGHETARGIASRRPAESGATPGVVTIPDAP